MYREMGDLLPMLSSPEKNTLRRKEVKDGAVLMMATESTRKHAVTEFKRRYASVPDSFWEWYQTLSDSSQKVAMFYVMLKTYRIFFDLQFNVVLQHWNSADQTVTIQDLLLGFNEIAARDEFVDSWSAKTKEKLSSAILSVLRKVGLLEENTANLKSPDFYDVDNGIQTPADTPNQLC